MSLSIIDAWFKNDYIFVKLSDGRVIKEALSRFKNLARGTQEQRNRYKIVHEGEALRWDELDEDLSLAGFLNNSSTDLSL